MKIVKATLLVIASGCAVFLSIKYDFLIVDNIAIYAVSILSYIAGSMINFFE